MSKDRVFLTVMGGVFPTQAAHEVQIPIATAAGDSPKPHLWFRTLNANFPDVKDGVGIFPRDQSIRLLPEIVIGTIDELVEDYRGKLTKAAKTLLEGPVHDKDDGKEALTVFCELGYQPGNAHSRPFIGPEEELFRRVWRRQMDHLRALCPDDKDL